MLLGAIADDFTGATDLCSMLVRGGMRTVQLIGVPPADLPVPEADAVVVALKSRTAPVRQAVDESRQLWMRYYTASRDALTERIVDPIRLLVTDGHAYLEGYCHSADAVRHFRVDRIEEIVVLDEPAQGQLWVDSDVPEQMFHPDPQIPPVTLRLAPSARWVADYYHAETTGNADELSEDGSVRVSLRAGGDEWLVRLMLSLGGGAVIEGRPDLALRVSERAAEALEAYR